MTEANFLDSLFSPEFQTWLRDFRQQAKEHSSSLTAGGYIRLIIIVGAYCMLRPYLVKLGGRFQASDHNRELDDDAAEMTSSPAAVSLRGRVGGVSEESSSSSEEGEMGKGWGRGVRRREKKRRRGLEEEGEKSKVDEDSDREIEEFLRKVID